MSMISLSDVKAIGRIDYDTHDTELQLLLDGAEAFAEQHCNIVFGQTTVTDERQDGGYRQLWPEKLPVVTSETVVVKDAWGDDDVVETSEYLVTETRIIADEDGEWGRGELRWKISYVGGYSDSTIPAGLKNAVIGLTLLMYDNPTGAKGRDAVNYEKLATDNDIIHVLDHFSLRRYVE